MSEADRTYRVQAYPALKTHRDLCDFVSRAAWHFAHVPQLELFVPLAPGLAPPSRLSPPEGFAPEVQAALDVYLSKVHFQSDQTSDAARSQLAQADVVLKLVENDGAVNADVAACNKTIYRVDPIKVRQEGSYFIQCAYDLCSEKEAGITDSHRKFVALLAQLGQHSKAWVMATGPSVEAFHEHDFGDSAVIVCNSVVLNDELMMRCKPVVLVFADPIFHFGVSEYAGKFRSVVEHRLATTDLAVVVPFKYYPLLISIWPQYAERIIGVPFEKMVRHNHDLRERFVVKTTANILTLLLLPLATTLARQVNLIGCDGRPLDQDDYFWGHGKSVQINDKMENIKRVHPGFFAIDYNEYYFEHCHTLANQLEQAEDAGWRFVHQGPSYIPALHDRSVLHLGMTLYESREAAALAHRSQSRHCVVLEPDGVGTGGHYLRWHRNLISELQEHFEHVSVLCNQKQDPTLFGCSGRAAFSVHSWTVSRSEFSLKRDFAKNMHFKRFVEELLSGLRILHDPLPRQLTLYMYYGSTQILKAVQLVRKELLSQGVDLKAFVCLFHESVILDTGQAEPRFPPEAAGVLLEGAAQIDHYRIASVTPRLADLVLGRFGVKTLAFSNPTPDRTDADSRAALTGSLARRKLNPSSPSVQVLLPTNPRDEKGGQIIRQLLQHLATHGVPAGQYYRVRGQASAGFPSVVNLEFLGEDISDKAYWTHLDEADVVVIPYTSPCFRFRTSGVLVDAMVSCASCIVLKDTWLGDVVEATGSGLVIDYRSPLSITSAVKVLGDHKSMLLRRAAKGAEAYLSENRWSSIAAMGRI